MSTLDVQHTDKRHSYCGWICTGRKNHGHNTIGLEWGSTPGICFTEAISSASCKVCSGPAAHAPAHATGHIRSPAITVLGEVSQGELVFSSHLETALKILLLAQRWEDIYHRLGMWTSVTHGVPMNVSPALSKPVSSPLQHHLTMLMTTIRESTGNAFAIVPWHTGINIYWLLLLIAIIISLPIILNFKKKKTVQK